MIKQNPFSLYDFLGYFIPGALVTYVIFLVNSTDSWNELLMQVNQTQEFQFDKFLLFTIISYSLGHLINFISSITIERYANWKYNYPSKYLLNFIEDHKFWNGGYIIIIWKILLVLILLPVVIFDFLLGNLFNFKAFYTKKLDDFLVELIKEKGLILFDKLTPRAQIDIRNYDFHRIFAHYTYENSKNHQNKLTNYVVLYGFLRTLTLISNLTFWFLVIKLFQDYNSQVSLFCNLSLNKNLIYSILSLSIITYIYFMAFMKFYRRYTLESLMLIAIDTTLVKSENGN